MLKKLLKYNLKSIIKTLSIFYCLALFFAILTRVFFSIENSLIMNIIARVCSGVTISMLFNILINNLMGLWVRFKQNLYGDESYLTHTLPVEKGVLYLSKVLTTLITLAISVAVIGITVFIAYYSKENIEVLKNMLLPFADAYGSTIVKLILVFLLILFLEFLNAIQAGFTGIILGHKMSNAKTGYSVLYGFVSYMTIQIFVLFVAFIFSLFNRDMMNLFITNEIVNVEVLKTLCYLVIFIYIVTFIINYIINLKMFRSGVDVE